MASLQELSGELASVVERVGKSVVRVEARRGRAGTGTIWGDDLVLTADHVVENEDNVQVTQDGKTVKAAVAGRDPGSDLALLRVAGLSGTAASLGRVADLKLGHLVLAIGRPSGLQATLGVVSSLSASWRSWRGGDVASLIQTNAELYPGFSGGPLVDVAGRVVGINSWHLGRGISRSIPVDVAEPVVESLKAHGRIRRAYLGVGTQPVALAEAVKARLNQDSGLLVVTVEPQSAADKAGLLQGDTLIALDGTAVRGLDDLFGSLRQLQVGSSHRLTLVRAGEQRELTVTLGERGR